MLKIIIEKEIKDILGSTKFAIIFSVCAILIVTAFYVGATRYNLNQSYHEATQAENLRRLDGLTDWLKVQDTRIFLPPSPLACLVSGVSNDIGRTIQVSGRGELVAEDSRYNEDPIYAVFRFLDLEFIFGIILSLFAVLLCYDAISGEKEQGTLRLTFANSVSRTTYMLGKLIGSFTALATSILTAISIGCLILVLKEVPMTGELWLRLFSIVAVGLLYFGSFLTLSIFVSSMTRRSSNAIIMLLLVWIVSVMIIPRVSVLAAGRAVDVPSVDEIANQKATHRTQVRNEFMDAMANFDNNKYEGSLDKNLMAFMDSLNTAREDKMTAFTNRLMEERYNRQVIQQRLALNLARISPSSSMTLAISRLAGTGLELSARFHDEAIAYQNIFAGFTKEKTGITAAGFMIYRVEENEDGSEPEKPEAIDAHEMPVFNYHEPSPGQTFAGAVVDFGILAIFNMLFFAGALVSFSKYDLR